MCVCSRVHLRVHKSCRIVPASAGPWLADVSCMGLFSPLWHCHSMLPHCERHKHLVVSLAQSPAATWIPGQPGWSVCGSVSRPWPRWSGLAAQNHRHCSQCGSFGSGVTDLCIISFLRKSAPSTCNNCDYAARDVAYSNVLANLLLVTGQVSCSSG